MQENKQKQSLLQINKKIHTYTQEQTEGAQHGLTWDGFSGTGGPTSGSAEKSGLATHDVMRQHNTGTSLNSQLLLVSGTRRDCQHQLLLTAARPAAHAHNTTLVTQ